MKVFGHFIKYVGQRKITRPSTIEITIEVELETIEEYFKVIEELRENALNYSTGTWRLTGREGEETFELVKEDE